MLGYTHAAIALALAKIFRIVDLDSYLEIFSIVLFAMLPDIDTPSSLLGKLFSPISRYLYAKFGHRNITHSLIFFLLTSNFFVMWKKFWLLFLLSYGSHLITDMLTYTGIPLFYPYKKNFTILGGPLITGKLVEILISAVAVLILTLY